MPRTHFRSRPRARRSYGRMILMATAVAAVSMGPAALLHMSEQPEGLSLDFLRLPTSLSPAPTPTPVVTASVVIDRALVDPAPSFSGGPLAFARNAPLKTGFTPPPAPRAAKVEPQAAPQSVPGVETIDVVQAVAAPVPLPVPLPVPRPREVALSAKAPAVPQVASTQTPRAAKAVAPQPVVPVNEPSFIEKLFGIRPASPPASAMSYAALDPSLGRLAPTRPSSTLVPDSATAVYDISARLVTLPSGETLEAHSGLGEKLDDPRFVHVRMKGATPPGTYILTEREALFHGVRALRMNPVGGSAAINGRDGILAHTYMLGPNGDSNGCISFRNYDRFLQAYLRGEVKRIVVVPGRGQDLLPRVASARGGLS